MVWIHKHLEKTIACAFCCIILDQLMWSGKLPCKDSAQKSLWLNWSNKQTNKESTTVQQIPWSIYLEVSHSAVSSSSPVWAPKTVECKQITLKLLQNIHWAFARQTYYSYSMIMWFVLLVVLFIALHITSRFFKSSPQTILA